MDAADVLNVSVKDPVEREVYLHQFVDQLRQSSIVQRRHDIAVSLVPQNTWTPVVAAVVEFICLEMHEPSPEWVGVVSETPVFIPDVPIDSPAAKVLRRVSPPSFSKRNVYVPTNFMDRC